MKETTQKQVDEAYIQVKNKWNQMKKEFTGSDCLFVMSREAIDFLGEYEIIKEQVIDMGLDMPVLDDKIQVTLS